MVLSNHIENQPIMNLLSLNIVLIISYSAEIFPGIINQGHCHFTPLPLSALIICPVMVAKRPAINSRSGVSHPVEDVKARIKLAKVVKIAKISTISPSKFKSNPPNILESCFNPLLTLIVSPIL